MATTTGQEQRKLFIETDMGSPQLLSFAVGNVAALCRRCPEKIEPNDDSAAVVETASGAIVLVVADGVGGGPMGHKASAIAVQEVSESVIASTSAGDLRPAILDGIEQANREILDLGVGAATTLALVEIQAGAARPYKVGDSMKLILGQRGALKWKSTAHSPVGYAVESGMLDEFDAMHHDDRHIVSNLVGCRNMRIEVGPSRLLAARDSVIVGSDGLFDNLHLEEVVRFAKSGKLVDRVERLADQATVRMIGNESDVPGKPDDLTILIYSR